MPTEFRSDRPPLTLFYRCLKLFDHGGHGFLRYANILIDTCAPLDQDAAYQFSSRSDQRLPSYNHLYVF